MDIQKLNHAGFKVKSDSGAIYFDPYDIRTHEGAAIVLISHEHFDHCSVSDLMKIVKADTMIVAAEECKTKLAAVKPKVQEIIYMNPGGKIALGKLQIEAVAAYNVSKFKSPGQPFHPRKDKKCGFVLTVEGKRIYHAGDTDLIPEMGKLKDIDIALLPVSGKYVMTADEAAEAVKMIRPKMAIPMHYGSVVGSKEDAERFWDRARGATKVKILD